MLPEPDPYARKLSAQLTALIAAEIAATGPMPFQRYMELALYAPGLGYYAAGAQKFGAGGDFITAPELGKVFAECIATALAPSLSSLVEPVLMEVGAGSGALAVGLLEALSARSALPARYLILERSADLRQRQQALIATRCPQHLQRVEWLDRPPEQSFDGAIVGNEVLDALACARFRVSADGLQERTVNWNGEHLFESECPARASVAAAVAALEADLGTQLPGDYVSEIVPELRPWFATVSASLRRGLILLADYGYGRPEYYRPERRDGTLICHYRQHVHHDPYWYPGLNDLSASVDFTALAEAADAAGFELLSYQNQADFMIACDIERLHASSADRNPIDQLRLASQIKRLMLPGEMGERFKVMLLGRAIDQDLLPVGLLGDGQRRML